MGEQDDDALWDEIVDAYIQFRSATGNKWTSIVDKAGTLGRSVKRRGFDGLYCLLALRLADEPIKRLLPYLVEIACVSQSRTGLGRELIKTLPRQWVYENIEPIANEILSRPDSESWEYRRLAELYMEIDVRLLKRLLDRALNSDDPNVRDVIADFQQYAQ